MRLLPTLEGLPTTIPASTAANIGGARDCSTLFFRHLCLNNSDEAWPCNFLCYIFVKLSSGLEGARGASTKEAGGEEQRRYLQLAGP